MSSGWRAIYADGTRLDSGSVDGAYAKIDRSKLTRFEITDGSFPLWGIDVPRGSRLVYRMRRTLALGGGRALMLVISLESEDRKAVDLYMLVPDQGGTRITRQPGYGRDIESFAPELYDYEVTS